MKSQSKPVAPPAEPAWSESDKELVQSFQAHLHLVITAKQRGQSGRLKAHTLIRITFLTVALLVQQPALAQRQVYKLDPETQARVETFYKSLIWFGQTNGLAFALLPPTPGSTEFSLYAKSLGTNCHWKWIAPTNEVKCKVQVSDVKGDLVQPTNKVVEALQHLEPKVTIDYYPKLPRGSTGQRYLSLWANDPALIGYIDLGRYYNLSAGGTFTVKFTPVLYDAQPDYIIGKLNEFPTGTYEWHLPVPEPPPKPAGTNRVNPKP